MRTRAAALAGVVLILLLGGCGGSPQAKPEPTSSAPTSEAPATTPSTPTVSATPTPTADFRTTVAIGSIMSVGVPKGWVVRRTPVTDGSGSVCLMPRGDTKAVFDCAGIAFDFGPHLPGQPPSSYKPDSVDGWYAATDVEPCPYVKRTNGSGLVGINTEAAFSKGLKPVGDHKADWNRWTASCAGRTFHPQAWYLPKSKVVIFDYLGHSSTAAILASATFASDGASLPAVPEYVTGHIQSATATTLVVRPFHTYTDNAAGKAYAAAHGLDYPFLDDYFDADIGGLRTITLSAATACVGGNILGKDIAGEPVACSDFASVVKKGVQVPAGFWVLPGGSAESVTEIFRP
jgi:hypothetical protein